MICLSKRRLREIEESILNIDEMLNDRSEQVDPATSSTSKQRSKRTKEQSEDGPMGKRAYNLHC